MKQLINLPAIILGLALLFTGPPQKAMAQYDDISVDSFYDELSPYGTWMNDPQYGRVWRPDVDQRDFRPYYSNGRWAMTEYGNTWVSDYDWGWAPFHYGRWVLNNYNQWLWIPDTVWGPAWVSWRSGGGYYGWAPLGPGINININIGSGGYNAPNSWWVFIPQHSIYSNYYPRYNGININIYRRTKFINYTYGRNRNTYYTGPRASEIRRATNRDVRVYQVSRSNRPGRTSISEDRINIYNPGGTRGGRSEIRNSGNIRQGTVDPGRNGGERNHAESSIRTRANRNDRATIEQRQRQSQQRDQQAQQQRQEQQRQSQQRDQQVQQQRQEQQRQSQQRDQQVQQQRQEQQRQSQQRQVQSQRSESGRSGGRGGRGN